MFDGNFASGRYVSEGLVRVSCRLWRRSWRVAMSMTSVEIRHPGNDNVLVLYADDRI